MDNVPDFLKDAIKQSPMLVAVLAVAYYAYRQLAIEHKSHLQSKDKEIDRLVEEKNALQKKFLANRLTTSDGKKAKG